MEPDGANPTRGRFAITSPFVPGAIAELTVFDVSGREVATVRAPAGDRLLWEGRTRGGLPAPSGIYMWRLEAGVHIREGKVVMVR